MEKLIAVIAQLTEEIKAVTPQTGYLVVAANALSTAKDNFTWHQESVEAQAKQKAEADAKALEAAKALVAEAQAKAAVAPSQA